MGVGDDVRAGRLAEDDAQAGHRGDLAGDDIAQHIAGADGGELVDIAHQEQVRAGLQGFEQVVGQQQVEHGGFIHHQQVDRQGVLGVEVEALAGLKASRRWMVLAGRPVASDRRLAARPVGEARA